MLHVHWLQCHCDLYRFLIPGIRESVGEEAIQNTPVQYVEYCQMACITNALRLCDLWGDIIEVGMQDTIDDPFFPISIYQVTQIIHHLPGLLRSDGRHSMQAVKHTLLAAFNLASQLQRKYPRVGACFRDTHNLLQVLGQRPARSVSREKNQTQGNPQHLPSLHSMIPGPSGPSGDSDAVELPSFNSCLRIPAPGRESRDGVSPRQYLVSLPSAAVWSGGQPSQPQNSGAGGDNVDPNHYPDLEPLDMFNMQLNGYFDLEQNGFITTLMNNELI